MEIILLSILVILLGILTVVIIILTQSISRISRLEEQALTQAEISTKVPEGLVPTHLQQGFEDIANKNQAYFDTLLQTSITSFDKQFHQDLQSQQTKLLSIFDKQFNQSTNKLNHEIERLSRRSAGEALEQTRLLDNQIEKLKRILEQRITDHYVEIAWQYITQNLQNSVDLHSQKESIFEQLNNQQSKIKKDYHVDKIT